MNTPAADKTNIAAETAEVADTVEHTVAKYHLRLCQLCSWFRRLMAPLACGLFHAAISKCQCCCCCCVGKCTHYICQFLPPIGSRVVLPFGFSTHFVGDCCYRWRFYILRQDCTSTHGICPQNVREHAQRHDQH